MLKIYGFLLTLLWSVSLASAEEPVKPCSSAEYRVLDFWVGSWKVSWEGGEGTNVISKSHGGCVINEKFESPALNGMSISMYNKAGGEWRQTWMDDQGGYFDFHGIQDGENYIFHAVPDSTKPDHQLRMVFQNITPDHLTWLWQKTTDGGQSWQEQWKINYQRQD